MSLMEHAQHGRGTSGPDDTDCPCRTTDKQAECSKAGCGFCKAAEECVVSYDSYQDTIAHIQRVRELLHVVRNELLVRAVKHDESKLHSPEKELFDRVTGKLRGMTYGSDEYKTSLAELKPALQHHYQHNSHHPEHYENGIDGMSLLDLIEMLVDWKAAGERHEDGSMVRSLLLNKDRFKISDQLATILENTAKELKLL